MKVRSILSIFKIYFCIFSDSHKKKAASSSLRRLDMISSAVRSALGRVGKESVKVEVNAHSPSLRV